MKFKSGKEAMLFFVERNGSVYYYNAMVSNMIESEGQSLEYKNYSQGGGHPVWATIVDICVDIDKIMQKFLTAREKDILIKWGEGNFLTHDERGIAPESLLERSQRMPFVDLKITQKYIRLIEAMRNFEVGLKANNYM